MDKKQIRAQYIKGLITDKENLSKILKESTKESLSSLLDESVNKNLRKMLAESADSYEEEEVNPDESEFDENPEENGGDETINLEGGENDSEGGVCPECGCEDGSCTCHCENGSCECETEGGEVWDEVSDTQDADGEYDLRGKDINTVLKVLSNMGEGDGIRIIKNDDDTATVEPENGESEFTINIEGGEQTAEPNEFENDGEENEDDYVDDIDIESLEGGEDTGDDETTFELEIDGDNNNEEQEDETMVNEGNVNLGYTADYQNKTAMTMPHDKGDGEGDSRFDKGAPKSDKKPWPGTNGKNNGNPYTQKTKQPMTEGEEECVFEVELGDTTSDVEGSDANISMPSMDEARGKGARPNWSNQRKNLGLDTNNQTGNAKRQISVNGEQHAEMNESALTRKINAVLQENKELRDIMAQFKQKLSEAVVINSSLAKVIKLVTENSTTRDEKINILNRFNKVNTLDESRQLYSQISSELNSTARVKSNNLLSSPITEAKGRNNNMVVETNMLNESSDLRNILDLQERMLNLGKKSEK